MVDDLTVPGLGVRITRFNTALDFNCGSKDLDHDGGIQIRIAELTARDFGGTRPARFCPATEHFRRPR